MIQGGKRRCLPRARLLRVRTDYTAAEVRLLAKQAKDAAQARRLLAIAAVLDGSSRTEAVTNQSVEAVTYRESSI